MANIVERLLDLADVFEAQQAPHNLVLHMRAGADEIARLRAGGCARDQGVTQYCAEAAKLAADNERLRAALIVWRNAYKTGRNEPLVQAFEHTETLAALEGK